MKERAILILNEEQIKKILFFHYIAELDSKKNDEILKKLKLSYKIIKKSTGMNIDFVLEYKSHLESLDSNINKEITVSIEDLNSIINEKLAEAEYEIDAVEEHLRNETAEFDSYSSRAHCYNRYIKYNLKKKEKVKTKTKSRGIK